MLTREQIRIRDPFILTDKERECYYMYGTTALEADSLRAGNTFLVYKTHDLEHFEEPREIFHGGKCGFWADRDYWAPEIHLWRGKYYLFGSFKAENRCRATQILVCDTPDGEFVPLTDRPATPEGWECLDGTFWVEQGIPYLIFSHEWTQISDGEIWAVALTEDLTGWAGEPFLLFRASDNPHVTALKKLPGCYVTDGPFLFREDGKLRMIWSSFYGERYLVLEAESDSLSGKWVHGGSRFDFDGGHAMLFDRLDGEKMISLHKPNTAGNERACFFKW
ncbi:MAG: family 43 glycosylhydrolase [Clostridia bacterium]|nr:family 43 glycosylhydrolase [Clostridia bacterium]